MRRTRRQHLHDSNQQSWNLKTQMARERFPFLQTSRFHGHITSQAMDTARTDSLVVVKERRPRSSISMAERLRCGMTGEMAGDLQSLLTKSKAIMQLIDGVIGKPSLDITQVLSNFLHDRVGRIA